MKKIMKYPNRPLTVLGIFLVFLTVPLSTIIVISKLNDASLIINAAGPTIDITTGAVQTFYQKGVPHTDSKGNIRTNFGPDSFLPNGIYFPSSGSIPAIAKAGFNTVISPASPSANLNSTLTEATSNNVKVIPLAQDYNCWNLPSNPTPTQLQNVFNNLKSSSNVLGWYIWDDTINCFTVYTAKWSNYPQSVSGWNGTTYNVYLDSGSIANKTSTAQTITYNGDPNSLKAIFSGLNPNQTYTWSVWLVGANVPVINGCGSNGANGLLSCGIVSTDPTNLKNYLSGIVGTYQPQTPQVFFNVDGKTSNSNWDSWWNQFANLGSVTAHYQYPVTSFPDFLTGDKSFKRIADIASVQTQQVKEQKPAWFIDQAWTGSFFGATWRFPTKVEARAMAYTALVHGATGLFHFSLDGPISRGDCDNYVIGISPNTQSTYPGACPTKSATVQQVTDSKNAWNNYDASQGGINKEILALEPIILSPTAVDSYQVLVDQTPISAAPIRTMLKKYMGNYYLMAVNIDNATINAKFSFPGKTFDSAMEMFKPGGQFVYWVHDVGQVNSPGNMPNPTSQTSETAHTFTGLTAGKTYSGVICSPDCSGTVIWSNNVVADGTGSVTLTVPASSSGSVLSGPGDVTQTFAPFDVHVYKLHVSAPTSLSPIVSSQNKVCSLLGSNQTSAGIGGQDGGTSLKIGSNSYWTFGDTTNIANAIILSNNVAATSQTDASACLSLAPKVNGTNAAALLNPISGQEISVWPDGMVTTDNSNGYFYYMSTRQCNAPEPCTWGSLGGLKVRGIGLAKFDSATMTATRIGDCTQITNCLFWQEADNVGFNIAGATAVLGNNDGYVYVYLNESPDGINQNAVRVARVPVGSIENKSAYQYLNINGNLFTWVGNLANSSQVMTFPNGFNGASVAFNQYLNKWTAIYTTNNFNTVAIRVSITPFGPWSQNELVLVDCKSIFPTDTGLRCYFGRQHSEFSSGNGQTIYLSYANQQTYQTYLHKIVLQNIDSDNDKFTDVQELYMGTDPNSVCSSITVDGWPPDVDRDGVVSILDLAKVASAFGAKTGDTNYKARYDMDADGHISILDLSKMASYFGQHCQTPVPVPPASQPNVNNLIPKTTQATQPASTATPTLSSTSSASPIPIK